MASRQKIKRAAQLLGVIVLFLFLHSAYSFLRWPSCGNFYGAISTASDGGEKDALGIMSHILTGHRPSQDDACAAFEWAPKLGEKPHGVSIFYSFARHELWFRSPKAGIKVARPTEPQEIQKVAKGGDDFSDFASNRSN